MTSRALDTRQRADQQRESDTDADRSLRLVDFIDRLKDDKELFLHCVRTVSDLMVEAPRFLTLDDRIRAAIGFFETYDARCVCVLDTAGDSAAAGAEPRRELVGIVSRRDVARILSHGHGTLMEDERDETSLRERLVAIVTRNPVTVAPTTPLDEAIQIMVDDDVEFLPVVGESNELVGTLAVTDFVNCFVQLDYLRRLRERSSQPARLIDVVRGGVKPTELLVDKFLGTVVDIMQPESEVAIRTDESIAAAMKMMEERRLRHLLVVNGRGRLKGMISDRDVMSYLPAQAPYAFGTVAARANLFRMDRGDTATTLALGAEVRLAMTGSPVTVEPTASIAEVAAVFCRQSLEALPVVSDEGRGAVQGIVTDTDFLRALFGLIRLAGGDLRNGLRR